MKILLLAAVFSLAACSASAQQSEVFQKDGAAINGYDPVAFFTEQKPIKGSLQYTTEWNNAMWLFSTPANRDSFARAPHKYAPQYGGYCAYGMADGHKAPTETGTWAIIKGKLYFNYNQKVKEIWNKNTEKFIQQANTNWETVKKE